MNEDTPLLKPSIGSEPWSFQRPTERSVTCLPLRHHSLLFPGQVWDEHCSPASGPVHFPFPLSVMLFLQVTELLQVGQSLLKRNLLSEAFTNDLF